jgi:F-type H+-transporting ATPase subunit c
MKKLSVILVLVSGLVLAASAAFAAATEGAAPDAVKIGFFGTVAFASAVGIAVAAFGGSIGMGLSISRAMEGIARNPEASGKIMTTMIVGLALIESLAIYTLVVVLILLYAKPFGI